MNKKYKIQFLDFSLNKKIPTSTVKIINKAIKERLEKDPNFYGKPLIGNLKNHRRLRVSVYRIVYHVNEEDKIVTIKAIDYRRDSYQSS